MCVFVSAHMHLYLMTGYVEDMYTGKMFKAENFIFFYYFVLITLNVHNHDMLCCRRQKM